jgi:hypothetical protein
MVAFASEDIPPASERQTEANSPATEGPQGNTLTPEEATQGEVLMDFDQDGTRQIYFFSHDEDTLNEERQLNAVETPVVEENHSLSLADYQALNDAMGEESNRSSLIPALGARYDDSILANEYDDIQDTDTFDVPVMALPETPVPIATDTPTDPATTDAPTDPTTTDAPADREAVANSPALDGTEGNNNPDTGAGDVTGEPANPNTGAASSLPLIVTAMLALGASPVLLRKKER